MGRNNKDAEPLVLNILGIISEFWFLDLYFALPLFVILLMEKLYF